MRIFAPIACAVLLVATLAGLPAFGQIQSAELVSAFFKDPAVEMNTPGFCKANGFMTYAAMMSFLESLADQRKDMLSIRFCGESLTGKKIPVVYLNRAGGQPKARIWMQGGLHGNEPAGTESLLLFIDYLVHAPAIDSVLNQVSFAFLPMANIDGYEKQVRGNANDADLNRDQVTLDQTESLSIKQAFTGFSPHVALDFHEFRPFRKELDQFSTDRLCIAQDVLFLPSGNLNIPAQLRHLTSEVYLKRIEEKLDRHQITFANYFVPDTRGNGTGFLSMGGDSPRSSSTSFGLTNTVSILFEIRGIGLERDSYKRRVYSGFLIAGSILETTLTNRKKVLQTVDASVRETIKRKNPIVLKAEPARYQDRMNFINTTTNTLVALDVEIEDTGRSKALLARKRPKAYILLAEQAGIVRKLQVLGLKTDTLKTDRSLKTEVFTLRSITPDSGRTNDSLIQITQQRRVFPKGSFVISTAQKNASVAVSTLEPEMENGYYTYKMIRAKPDGEIPVYRCLTDLN